MNNAILATANMKCMPQRNISWGTYVSHNHTHIEFWWSI